MRISEDFRPFAHSILGAFSDLPAGVTPDGVTIVPEEQMFGEEVGPPRAVRQRGLIPRQPRARRRTGLRASSEDRGRPRDGPGASRQSRSHTARQRTRATPRQPVPPEPSCPVRRSPRTSPPRSLDGTSACKSSHNRDGARSSRGRRLLHGGARTQCLVCREGRGRGYETGSPSRATLAEQPTPASCSSSEYGSSSRSAAAVTRCPSPVLPLPEHRHGDKCYTADSRHKSRGADAPHSWVRFDPQAPQSFLTEK